MRNRVANRATVALLVGALALTLLYARSFWVNDIWDKQSWVGAELRAHAVGVESIAGRLVWFRSDMVITSQKLIAVYEANTKRIGEPRWEYGWRSVTLAERKAWYRPWWRVNRRMTADFSLDSVMGAVPCWPVVIGAWWLAVWRVRREARRRRWVREGRCLRCGYDLRASGEVCPECGVASAGVGGG